MTREPTNFDRARRAVAILVAYAAEEDRQEELATSGQAATLVTDLLADVMHYAERSGIDFQNCLDVAGMHFEAEFRKATEAARGP